MKTERRLLYARLNGTMKKTTKTSDQEAASKPDTKQQPRITQQFAKVALTGNRFIAALAMKDATAAQKLVVYTCFAITTVAILITVLPPYELAKGLATLAMLIVSLGVTGFIVVQRFAFTQQQVAHTKSGAVTEAPTSETGQLLRRRQTAFERATLIALPVLFLSYFAVRLFGFDPLYYALPIWRQTFQTGSLKRTIESASKARLPYAVESLVVLLTLDDKTNIRRADYRYIYTLRALEDIRENAETFRETFHKHFGTEMIYWHGPDQQRQYHPQTETEISFEVGFSVNKGDVFTVVTGLTISDKLPMPAREIHGFHFASNQNSVFYPNESDFISQLTIIVTSATASLGTTPNSAWRKPAEGLRQIVASQIAKNHPETWKGVTLSARFRDVKPKETVGLQYHW